MTPTLSDEQKNQLALQVAREVKLGQQDEALLARASIEFGPDDKAVQHAYSRMRFQQLQKARIQQIVEQAPPAQNPTIALRSEIVSAPVRNAEVKNSPKVKAGAEAKEVGKALKAWRFTAAGLSVALLIAQPANVVATGRLANWIGGVVISIGIACVIALIGKLARPSRVPEQTFWCTYSVFLGLLLFGWHM